MSGINFEPIDINKYIEGMDSKIVVNDMDIRTPEGFERLSRLLYTTYDSDKLSDMPSCSCGKLYGNFRKGEYHEECGSYVEDRYSKIEPLLVVRKLSTDLPFILPDIYNSLKYLTIKGRSENTGVSLLDYLIDPNYSWEDRGASSAVSKNSVRTFIELANEIVLKNDINRGYRSFIGNFFVILDRIIEMYEVLKLDHTVHGLRTLREVCLQHKEKIFIDYLLLPNRIWLSIENTPTNKYGNQNPAPIMNIANIAAKNNKPSLAERNTIKIMSYISNYVEETAQTQLDGKPGLIRKHICGSRIPLSFRCVITSIMSPWDYECVKAPWAYAIKAYRPYLINLLVNYFNYNYRQAVTVVSTELMYNEDTDSCFRMLIEGYQSMGLKGIPITMNRNPSIKNGSLAPVYILEVKTDPLDMTFSIPGMIVKPFNADFDGDETNQMLLPDMAMVEALEPLSLYYDIISDSFPMKINGIYIPSPLVTMINNYLYG